MCERLFLFSFSSFFYFLLFFFFFLQGWDSRINNEIECSPHVQLFLSTFCLLALPCLPEAGQSSPEGHHRFVACPCQHWHWSASLPGRVKSEHTSVPTCAYCSPGSVQYCHILLNLTVKGYWKMLYVYTHKGMFSFGGFIFRRPDLEFWCQNQSYFTKTFPASPGRWNSSAVGQTEAPHPGMGIGCGSADFRWRKKKSPPQRIKRSAQISM